MLVADQAEIFGLISKHEFIQSGHTVDQITYKLRVEHVQFSVIRIRSMTYHLVWYIFAI